MWEVEGFRTSHASAQDQASLGSICNRVFLNHAKRFVKDKKFKKHVENDPKFAWAMVYLLTKRMD